MFCQIYWRWRLNSSAFCSYVNCTWGKPLPSNIFLVKRVLYRESKVVNTLFSPKKRQYYVKSKKSSPVKIARIVIIDWNMKFSVHDYVSCHLRQWLSFTTVYICHVYFPHSYQWILELSFLKITANWLERKYSLPCSYSCINLWSSIIVTHFRG